MRSDNLGPSPRPVILRLSVHRVPCISIAGVPGAAVGQNLVGFPLPTPALGLTLSLAVGSLPLKLDKVSVYKQSKIDREKVVGRMLPLGGDDGPQDLILLIGSIGGRFLLLLQVLGKGGGGLALLRFCFWLIPARRQVILRQLLELENKVYISIWQHCMFCWINCEGQDRYL